MTLKKALETTPELQKMKDSDPDVKTLLDMAQKVEGNARHISVHAAAVIVGPDDLVNIPLCNSSLAEATVIITQYEMHASEEVGLIKLDILGISKPHHFGQRRQDCPSSSPTSRSILRNFPSTIKKPSRCWLVEKTFGVFPNGRRRYDNHLMDLHPERIEDLMAMVCPYRPGPMGFIPEYIERKRDPSKVKYFVPGLEKILDQSYGIITYQDDVLFMAIQLAGYNWEEADKFRKAIGKKIVSEMEGQHAKFVDGCVEYGHIPRDKAEELFKQIETFAAYGFNKAQPPPMASFLTGLLILRPTTRLST